MEVLITVIGLTMILIAVGSIAFGVFVLVGFGIYQTIKYIGEKK